MGRILLASRGIPRLKELLGPDRRHAVLVPTAANPLDEPEIAGEVERELRGAGLEVEPLDLDVADRARVRVGVGGAEVVAVSGGDPFHLLAAARRTGFGVAVRQALAAGGVYVGYSAGAVIAGPTLEPVRMTSPFDPPAGLELTGLGLVDVVTLPHANRPGRAERHEAAREAFGERVELHPLADGEVLVIDV